MSTKLFIGGLSWSTNDESLRARFEEFGKVEDCIVIRDRETGRSRGFGFVTYASSEEADNAVRSLNDQEFEGRNIRVDRATERAEGERPPRSYGNSSFGRGRPGFRPNNGGRFGGRSNGGGYGGERSYGDRDGGYGDRRRTFD